MKHLDLFSGIGGFALAARWAGFETVGFCEIEDYPRKVLAKNFPSVPIHRDIRELDGSNYEAIELITGGYPCQPFSSAGNRRGSEDERHLWPEMFRVIRESKPRWVVAENVAGHVSMGLDEVLSDLESEGYETIPIIIPAVAVGAPHRRDRVWIIANTNSEFIRKQSGRVKWQGGESALFTGINGKEKSMEFQKLPNPKGINVQKQYEETISKFSSISIKFRRMGKTIGAITNEAEPAVCGAIDGISSRMVKNRTKRLECLGNAIVPQVAYQILKSIAELAALEVTE